ncbi:gamma-glutamyltransferase [Microbacterium sp. BK668]|uniref:gamma-glutamyltransferase n=1 Tax=Microbacterium sp. BK668 TaxID=2512118 RepID=UPI001061F7E8|nr:gamma-glutamyltransferase [Microbacterium sp. BK668]
MVAHDVHPSPHGTAADFGSLPVVQRGKRGAVSAAHPLATAAGLTMLARGGSAVDAAIAAQAMICVVLPDAAGLGGDVLALVRRADGVTTINGVGRSPGVAPPRWTNDGGGSVTVPGLVDGWIELHARGGRLALAEVLEPAVRTAENTPLTRGTASSAAAQRARLDAYGGAGWALLQAVDARAESWAQPELAQLLHAVGTRGRDAFYSGSAATAIARAASRTGGSLSPDDLARHATLVGDPIVVPWNGGELLVQPPPSQAVLLAMAAGWLDRRAPVYEASLPHVLVELTQSVFAHRADAGRGEELLREPLDVDPERASRRGGPRAYLHTAGVAAADAEGTVVSSLVSVFDDFGSGVFVPELGIVLANRAAGFTEGANAPRPNGYPVHTLAPALLRGGGATTALATPGADGQVQTLLQILAARRYGGEDWPQALAASRWRSEDAKLLVERGHPARAALHSRGHDVVSRAYGEDVFGAVVIAGVDGEGPFALADPRRDVEAGAA